MNYNTRYKKAFIVSFIANILMAVTLIVIMTQYPFSRSEPVATVTPAVLSATDVVSVTDTEPSPTDVSPSDVSDADVTEETTETTETTTTMRTRADNDAPRKTAAPATAAPTTAAPTTAAPTTAPTAAPTEPPVGDDNDGEWLGEWY